MKIQLSAAVILAFAATAMVVSAVQDEMVDKPSEETSPDAINDKERSLYFSSGPRDYRTYNSVRSETLFDIHVWEEILSGNL